MKQMPSFPLWLFASAALVFSACTNDNEEDLNPQPNSCDTSSVTFSGTIRPILAANCYSCHSTGFSSGGVTLDTHVGVLAQAQNGKLVGVVSHAPGFKTMPQGGAKLADCDIEKIKKWVADGSANN